MRTTYFHGLKTHEPVRNWIVGHLKASFVLNLCDLSTSPHIEEEGLVDEVKGDKVTIAGQLGLVKNASIHLNALLCGDLVDEKLVDHVTLHQVHVSYQ